MSIQIEIDGMTVTASTAAEAVDFVRELRKKPSDTNPVNGAPNIPEAIKLGLPAATSSDDLRMALEFLTIIRDTPSGANQGLIRQALHVDHAKGIGSKSAVINRILESLGFRKDDVYTNNRVRNNGRLWKPQRRIREAVETIGNAYETSIGNKLI